MPDYDRGGTTPNELANFLREYGIDVAIKYTDEQRSPPWGEGEYDGHMEYLITIRRDGRRFSYHFWKNGEPSLPEALSTIGNEVFPVLFGDYDTFSDFTGATGFEPTDPTAQRAYKHIQLLADKAERVLGKMVIEDMTRILEHEGFT